MFHQLKININFTIIKTYVKLNPNEIHQKKKKK